MTYNGHIHNGAIVLDEASTLPEGAAIRVVVLPQVTSEAPAVDPVPSLFDRYKDVIGIADGLPEDLALNHDHYLHGRPKK